MQSALVRERAHPKHLLRKLTSRSHRSIPRLGPSSRRAGRSGRSLRPRSLVPSLPVKLLLFHRSNRCLRRSSVRPFRRLWRNTDQQCDQYGRSVCREGKVLFQFHGSFLCVERKCLCLSLLVAKDVE